MLLPVPVSQAKLEQLVKLLLRSDALSRLEAKQIKKAQMEMVAKSKLLQEFFFHQRIVQEVQAAVHPRLTTDLQKYKNFEREHMMRTLADKVFQEASAFLSTEKMMEMRRTAYEHVLGDKHPEYLALFSSS